MMMIRTMMCRQLVLSSSFSLFTNAGNVGCSAKDMTASLPSSTVYLNLYDIIPHNDVLYPFGFGVHHTGVEVYGYEFAFGRGPKGSGVFQCSPKHCQGHIFREQLVLGNTNYTQSEVEAWFMWIREESAKSATVSGSGPSPGNSTRSTGREEERGGTAAVTCSSSLRGIPPSSGSDEGEDGTPQRWNAQRYHLLRNNCNHFSEHVARKLLPASLLQQKFASPASVVYDTGDEEVRVFWKSVDGVVIHPPLIDDAGVTARSSPATERRSAATCGTVRVRKLVPPWVNRLARSGASWLPEQWIEKMEELDRAAQGIL